MTTTDLIVIGAITLVACYPLIQKAIASFLTRPTAVVEDSSDDLWRQRWVSTLIDLQSDLEERSVDSQVALVRQLIWEMLGGEGKKK